MTRARHLAAAVLLLVALLVGGCESKQEAAQREAKARSAALAAEAAPVVKTFDRIQSDLDVGINYLDYSRRLQDANAELQSFNPEGDDGARVKTKLLEALLYYVAAREAWNWDNQGAWPADVETAIHWKRDYPEVVAAYPKILAPYPELVDGSSAPNPAEPRYPEAVPKEVRQAAWDVADKRVLDVKAILTK